jgi:hypothetical protein
MGENAYPDHGLRGKRYFLVYNNLYRMQEGKCAICGYKVGDIWFFGTPVYRLVIDHSHTTGSIRGLLCNGCNNAVGHYETGKLHIIEAMSSTIDDIQAKIEAYLEGWNERYRTYHHR